MNHKKLSKIERLSLVSLVLLLVVYILITNVLRSTKSSLVVDVEYIDQKDTLLKDKKSTKHINKDKKKTSSSNQINYKFFYPDSLNREGWIKIGFSKKQAEAIINFKNSSGGFNEPKDLEKVYVISSQKFEEMLPYLKFDKPVKKLIKGEINTASTEQLIRVKGIGEVLAQRIIDYRDKLGGFHISEQLKSVYGLENEVIERVALSFEFNQSEIQKVNINDASKKELKKLPYLSFISLSAILKERDNKRLKNIDFLSSEVLTKKNRELLLPYIEF